MAATKKNNRVSGSNPAILIAAFSLITTVNIYASPPSEKLYDHSRVEEISAEDMRSIVMQSNKYNRQNWPPSFGRNYKTPYCRTLFFDGLQSIDKETAKELRQNMTNGSNRMWPGHVFLGVTSIDDDVLKELVADIDASSRSPYIDILVFSRLKKLSDKQANILLEWQGEYLLVPEGIEITPEAMKLIRKRYHTWRLFWAAEEGIAEQRKHLVDENVGD